MKNGEHETGMLTWGVKQSLRGYVEGMAGSIGVSNGAAQTTDGEFAFGVATDSSLVVGPDGQLTGKGKFVGKVRFEAHDGALSIVIADPEVEFTERWILTVAGSTAGRPRVELALLDVAAAKSLDGELIIPSVLSKEGWRVMGDDYMALTPLDPVRLKLRDR